MAMGKRKQRQEELFIMADQLPRSTMLEANAAMKAIVPRHGRGLEGVCDAVDAGRGSD